jgi:hypothetical protein
MREPFVDGGMGCNNPIKQVLSEAERIFPGRHIACVISIGTGQVPSPGLLTPSLLNKVFPFNVIPALKKITTECEVTAQETERRFKPVADFYFRFNVTQGMQNVTLAQWERLPEVTTHTLQYLQEESQRVATAVAALRERREVIASAHLSAYSL